MIKVRVPATSANIGPGFDTMGLALQLYNEFRFESLETGVEIVGFDEKFKNEGNLVLQSLRRLYDAAGRELKGVRISIEENIPVSRGLGSSAACIVGGIMGGNALLGDVFSREEMIQLAVEIEGHPDNVVPAFEGGFTVSLAKEGKIRYEKLVFDSENLFLYAMIPDFEVSTARAREVLPKAFSLEDAVFNISRTAMLVASLVNGRFGDLWEILEDRVHQPYRSRLIAGFDDIETKMKRLGFDGLFISGAGPSLMGVLSKADENKVTELKAFLETLESGWHVECLNIDWEGARIL